MISDENNDDECYERADYILNDVVKFDLKGKKLLDFGCGAGHVADLASKVAGSSHGFDIHRHKNKIWSSDSIKFTSNWPNIISDGPYDFVISHDVFDHSRFPLEDMHRVFSVLKPGGKAFFRCHPICSRHGGHLYKTFNKAFAHLVLNENELKDLSLKLPPQRVIYPIKTYESYANRIGFKIISTIAVQQDVEDFFVNNDLVADRILAFYGSSSGAGPVPLFQMSQSYVDMLVTK